MNFSLAIKQDYHAGLLMLDTAYSSIVERGLKSRRASDVPSAETAQRALTILLEATLESLNTSIDGAIAACDLATKPKDPTIADHRAARETRLADLEGRFGFKRDDLPGWREVAKTNDQANAVKHRLGITLRTGTTTPLSVKDVVELDEKELLLRMDEVYRWILALGEACKLP